MLLSFPTAALPQPALAAGLRSAGILKSESRAPAPEESVPLPPLGLAVRALLPKPFIGLLITVLAVLLLPRFEGLLEFGAALVEGKVNSSNTELFGGVFPMPELPTELSGGRGAWLAKGGEWLGPNPLLLPPPGLPRGALAMGLNSGAVRRRLALPEMGVEFWKLVGLVYALILIYSTNL